MNPPRLAISLLRAALPAHDADAIAGDLIEIFTDRTGRHFNTLWFWSAALLVVLRFTLAGVRRDRRGPWRAVVFDRIWSGFHQSLRRLRFEWRYALGVVVVLAIGIGPAAAMLSIVETVWLHPLGYANPDRLGIVRIDLGDGIKNHPGLTLSEILDLRRTEGLFDGVEGEARQFDLSLGSGSVLRSVSAIGVTPGLLPMIGVSPAVGRTFTDADVNADAGAPVMIDYGLWQSSFGGAADIVGRRILLDGRSREIIGVLPRGFTLITGRSVPEPVDVYTTLLVREHRNFWGYPTLVRLKPGVSFEAANLALARLSQTLSKEFSVAYGTTGMLMAITPLKDDLLRDTRPALRAALAAVFLLLLVAVANATALVVARLKVRERELAVRSAIGAGRGALAFEVLMESLILGIGAASAGTAIAALCITGARALVPHTVPRWQDITLGWELVLYSGGFALAGLFVAGLVPLTKVSGGSSWQALRASTLQGGRPEGATSRLVLVGAQIVLTVVLGFGATQLLRSAQHLRAVNLGFDPNVLTFRVPIDQMAFRPPVRAARLYEEVRDRLRELPGVTAVGAVSHLPLTGSVLTDGYSTDLSKDPAWGQPTANYYAVTPGYFAAMKIPLVAGRDLTDADDQDGRHVIVVSDGLARATFGSADRAIGRMLKLGWGIPDSEIVGVAGQVRGIDVMRDVRPQIYVPFGTFTFSPMHMIVRASGDPARLADAARAVVAPLGTGRAVSAFGVLTDNVATATSTLRSVTGLVALLAISAGLLAAGGLYTVIAYIVYQRRRSTAIRSALGASPAQLLWLHFGLSNRVLAVALPVSLVLAAAAAPLFSSLLYGVAERDVTSLILAAAVATLVSLVSTLVPARRAAHVDPVSVLRAD